MVDGIDFRDDGTITVTDGDRVERIRRPTIGELRALMADIGQVADLITELAESRVATDTAIRRRMQAAEEAEQAAIGEADDPSGLLEERAQRRLADKRELSKIGDEFTRQVDEAHLKFTLRAFEMLSAQATPWTTLDVEKLPAWMASRDLPVRMRRHWQTVPSPAGPA